MAAEISAHSSTLLDRACNPNASKHETTGAKLRQIDMLFSTVASTAAHISTLFFLAKL